MERADFLGSRLMLLDKIIQTSIDCKQRSNAVGALKLQAQLTPLPEGSWALNSTTEDSLRLSKVAPSASRFVFQGLRLQAHRGLDDAVVGDVLP